MPRARRRAPRGLYGLLAVVAASIALLFAFAPNRRAAAAGPTLALDAPLPTHVTRATVLTVGDPLTRYVFQHLGWERQLPFTIRWAEITGGPDVTEAFHAHALDVGLGASVPPIHAHWAGLPVRVVAVQERLDPFGTPAFVWGIAPHAGIRRLADLRGKRIAFSPSQVQAEIVIRTLRAVGLSTRDVTLVELPSSIGGDVYTSALGSGVVDAAPIGGGIISGRYLARFPGATVLPHPPFRDDLALSYVPEDVLRDPAKAAALRVYVQWWVKAQQWRQAHPDEMTRGYYGAERGLGAADARLVVQALGGVALPADWRDAEARQQGTIDLLSLQVGHPAFRAADLFDHRFEALATVPARLAAR